MEWNKAKNILIVTFLILDIILGIMLFYSNSDTIRIKQSDIEECSKILKSHNVLLKADIPQTIKPLANLSVSNVTTDKNMMAELVKDTPYMQGNLDYKDHSLIHHYDNYYTGGFNCMKKKKEILFEVKKILNEKKINTRFLKLESFKQNKVKVRVIYKEIYEGYNIQKSYLEIIIARMGFVTINYKGYLPNGFKSETNNLVSPLDSLITMLNVLKHNDKENSKVKKCIISGINQVYYVEETEKQNMSQTEAIPAWQIVVTKIYKDNSKHNKRYYINAYENSLLR